jgi:hypothetical protein
LPFLSRNVRVRVTPDIRRFTDSTGQLASSLVFRIKYAFVQLDNVGAERSWMRCGIGQTPFVDFEESIDRYRVQGTVLAERAAMLLAAVVGSGIMADRLSGGNQTVALLANALATGAALVALMLTFGSISAAHFNPAVTIADASQGGLAWRHVPGYLLAQFGGAIGGVWVAHLMFEERMLMLSLHERSAMAATFLFRWMVPALPKTAECRGTARRSGMK